MKSFKFWKKLNCIIKSKEPMKSAREMVESGNMSSEELAWALVTLATLPIAMLDLLEKQ